MTEKGLPGGPGPRGPARGNGGRQWVCRLRVTEATNRALARYTRERKRPTEADEMPLCSVICWPSKRHISDCDRVIEYISQ